MSGKYLDKTGNLKSNTSPSFSEICDLNSLNGTCWCPPVLELLHPTQTVYIMRWLVTDWIAQLEDLGTSSFEVTSLRLTNICCYDRVVLLKCLQFRYTKNCEYSIQSGLIEIRLYNHI